jgi:hypothetical protein
VYTGYVRLVSTQSLMITALLSFPNSLLSLIDGFGGDLLWYEVYVNITCENTECCITIISTPFHKDIFLLIISSEELGKGISC